jgi:hypothetical protein
MNFNEIFFVLRLFEGPGKIARNFCPGKKSGGARG